MGKGNSTNQTDSKVLENAMLAAMGIILAVILLLIYFA